MVIYRGVNFYPRQIESLILSQPGAGHEYQIVLERAPGGSDRLLLLVEAGSGFAAGTLQARIRDTLSLSPEITVLAEGSIPRPPGKSVRVVDRRPR
jgi:phenylacetate-coenzyme A ligase PaaK-like adenylate-forming protein